ncbi:hypothetical protein C7S18_11850 [Ahniella affigens]|uniref:Beta-lactamase n=1 Tax=Ahniella affigens TaxID=2021234 RepID=A0A2P1PSN3_9GAMM|nr:penicillin-binding transpeptidase domain-containing protein [Ahniella affigens]AVP97845.1 hypothetical protein C7S18_11850 [Ahniella affigens]
MFKSVLSLVFGAALGLPALVAAADASPKVAESFRAYGSDGAFVTRTGNETQVHFGKEWAEKPVHPASSFKVLLALIGLETGSIKDVNEVFPWDGRPYPDNKVWEQDMALQEAMATSSESYFKIVAKRIGRDRLQSFVQRVNYGSINISANPETAWTDGVLTITVPQQLDFMQRLANNDLPFRPDVMNTVKAVTLDRFDAELGIHGKTGTSFRDGSGFGWWVGWVDAKPASGRVQPTAFALLVTLKKIDGRDKRTALGRELLREVGVIERRGL